MGDVVNLRMARKGKRRATAAQGAAENRARHGRTKAERQAEAAEAERLARRIDQSRLDDAGPAQKP